MSSFSVTPLSRAKARWKRSWSAAAGDQRRDGDEAAVAFGEFGALPHLVEEHLVGVVHEAGGEVAERALSAGPAGHALRS